MSDPPGACIGARPRDSERRPLERLALTGSFHPCQHFLGGDSLVGHYGHGSDARPEGNEIVPSADLRAVPRIVKYSHAAWTELSAEVLDGFVHTLVVGIAHQRHGKAQLAQCGCHVCGIIAGILERSEVLTVGRIAND